MRSPTPGDFTEEQVIRLDEAAIHIIDPDLLARVYDVVWIKLKRHEAAKRAIDAYLMAAKDPRYMEIFRFDRLKRAFRLAKQIKAKDKYQECEKVYAEFKEMPKLFKVLAVNLFSLAQEFKTILHS